jgi:hypothetical protein
MIASLANAGALWEPDWIDAARTAFPRGLRQARRRRQAVPFLSRRQKAASRFFRRLCRHGARRARALGSNPRPLLFGTRGRLDAHAGRRLLGRRAGRLRLFPEPRSARPGAHAHGVRFTNSLRQTA